nr:MAG TPA: hypothetical protein [Caudoviricetes sp.]DAW85473.1 MAG TPA: hypothetical protein [Bacteriophage sp.]
MFSGGKRGGKEPYTPKSIWFNIQLFRKLFH